MRSIKRSQVTSLTNLRLDSHRDASASCCVFAHAQSGLKIGQSCDLRSHFVIRARQARFFLVDFLANKKERQERLSQRHSPCGQPLSEHTCEIYSPVEFPFKAESSGCLGTRRTVISACIRRSPQITLSALRVVDKRASFRLRTKLQRSAVFRLLHSRNTGKIDGSLPTLILSLTPGCRLLATLISIISAQFYQPFIMPTR